MRNVFSGLFKNPVLWWLVGFIVVPFLVFYVVSEIELARERRRGQAIEFERPATTTDPQFSRTRRH